MARSIPQLAKEALDVQDASNLSGLVHGWSRSVTELRENLPGAGTDGTDGINNHPINRLWAAKVASLSGVANELSLENYSKAIDDCFSLANTD